MRNLNTWLQKQKDEHLFTLVHYKQMLGGRFARTHYSQFGEDIAIEKILPEPVGTYVDVGAFHPYHYSNTYVLHKRGWSGINIDPNRDSIAYFNKYRPNDINLVCGVSDTDTEHPYFVYNHQSCNTFSEEQKLHNEHKKHLTLLRTDLVRCRPLRDILNKHLDKGEQVDVLNVDVEGLDLMVLKTNDWERYRPRLVVVESEVRTGEELWQSATYTFLRERGYHLVGWMGASLLFKGL